MILCCNDDVGLFAIGTDMLIPQHLQTVTLIMQHKPIERWTNMASIAKKYQTQAWLKTRYWQRMTSKHVHAGRPGVPAPVMIKRNPIFHHLWRSEQYRAFAFSLVTQNQTFITSTYFGLLQVCLHWNHVPAAVVPCHSGCGYFLSRFAKCFTVKAVSFLQNGRCVSQNIILPNYHFARMLFCQNIMLPK